MSVQLLVAIFFTFGAVIGLPILMFRALHHGPQKWRPAQKVLKQLSSELYHEGFGDLSVPELNTLTELIAEPNGTRFNFGSGLIEHALRFGWRRQVDETSTVVFYGYTFSPYGEFIPAGEYSMVGLNYLRPSNEVLKIVPNSNADSSPMWKEMSVKIEDDMLFSSVAIVSSSLPNKLSQVLPKSFLDWYQQVRPSDTLYFTQSHIFAASSGRPTTDDIRRRIELLTAAQKILVINT